MSLDAQYDSNNIFAKILRGEIPCIKVYEDEYVLSFMDLFPQSRGHTLVLPKEAATNLFEVKTDTLQQLIARVQLIARAVRGALAPDGITITQFNGATAGQSVFHIHFHIVPRYEGEALRGHGGGGQADAAELESLAARIAAVIDR
jgi:histidine triad (HIT) family protein